MQMRIYQRLNQLLIGMVVSTVIIIAYALINLSTVREYLLTYFLVSLAYSVICFLIFKMLENNWDKRMMQRMAIKGQIVIANIKESEKLMQIKDSGGRYYNLWKITVTYWDQQMNRHEGILIDKFSPLVATIPLGTIYMTNDEKKPLKRFILQNVIIGNIPTLRPIVAGYEKNKAIRIKYLNVYYRDGLVIETYKQSLAEARKEAAQAA